MSEPRPWPLRGTRDGADHRLFRVRFDRLENPRTGVEMERLVCETPDWVNVVALTADRHVVLVRQYRFGVREVCLEIPGGVVDPGEDPAGAAARELREETGFTAERWTPLGSVDPNPAYQDNACHHFLAEGCVRSHDQEQDPGEDIVVATLPLDEVVACVHDGRIRHALAITALGRVADLRLPRGGARRAGS